MIVKYACSRHGVTEAYLVSGETPFCRNCLEENHGVDLGSTPAREGIPSVSLLKPCPWCGAPPYTDTETLSVFGLSRCVKFAVACSDCEAIAMGAETICEAIRIWETRA